MLSGICCTVQNESVKKYKIKISIEAERKTKIELKECVKETASKCYYGMHDLEVND
jgi:hypothetical protein